MKEIHVPLSELQQKQIKKYLNTHFCEAFQRGDLGFAPTSKLQLIVGWTSIGGTLRIRCPYCNYEEDITDIDMW